MIVSREKGMTLLEIVFAFFVLALVLVSLIGVMGVATRLIRESKLETIATAIANEEIERIRTLPYGQVGLLSPPSPDVPTGTLPETTQVTRMGVTFTVAYDIRWVDDAYDGLGEEDKTRPGEGKGQDYKILKVTVSWQSGGKTSSVRVSSYIREIPRTNRRPFVKYQDLAPSAGSVVWDQGEGVSIPLYALDYDGYISTVRYSIDGYYPPGSSYSYSSPEVNHIFIWNTYYIPTGSTTPFKDGARKVIIEAWDNSGGQDRKERIWCLDNYPPETPTGLETSETAITTETIPLFWTASWDATTPGWATIHAYSYLIYQSRNGSPFSQVGAVTATGELPYIMDNCPTTYTDKNLTPFTYYGYYLVAKSPRGLTSSASAILTTKTRIRAWVSGIISSGVKRQLVFSWEGPTFTSDSTYTLERSTSSSGPWTQDAGPTTLLTLTGSQITKNDTYYYRVKAKYLYGVVSDTNISNLILFDRDTISYP